MAALLTLTLLTAVAFAQSGEEKLTVLVTILPQACFVGKVGGALVNVEVLVGAGQDPHTYEVTPKQMARFGRARVYFKVGLPLEARVLGRKDLLAGDMEVVDTRQGVPLLQAGAAGDPRDRGNPGDPHGGGGGPEGPGAARAGNDDPHIWLDPKRVKIQAGTICEALIRAAPGHADAFRANLEAFLRELEELDRRIANRLSPNRGAKMYVFHPAFGYFCDSYGLRQVAVEAEGKEPSARELAGLIDRARKDKVKALFVEPQFATADAETIAGAIGAELVLVDPLPGDYARELDRLADRLADSLAGAPGNRPP